MRTRTALVGWVLGLGAALPGACVLEDADTGSPLAMLRARQQADVDALARAFCTSYYACECEEDWPDFDDEPECLDFVGKLLLGHLEQGIDADLPYDDTCLAAHVELIEHLGCTDGQRFLFDDRLPELWETAEHCRSYAGELTLGEPCHALPTGRGDDCAPGLTCHADFATCQDLAPIPEGELCDGDGDERPCKAGTVCTDNLNGVDPARCLAPSPVGQPCAGGWLCELEAMCNDDTRQCQARLPAGSDCFGEYDDRCELGLRCRDQTCQRDALEGEPCGSGCAIGLTCNTILDLCEAPPAIVCSMQERLP